MKQLKKGDPCRVRLLKTGEVVSADYFRPSQFNEKFHVLNDGDLIAIGGYTLKNRIEHKNARDHECIFVGNPCVLPPVEARL